MVIAIRFLTLNIWQPCRKGQRGETLNSRDFDSFNLTTVVVGAIEALWAVRVILFSLGTDLEHIFMWPAIITVMIIRMQSMLSQFSYRSRNGF